MPLLDWDDDYSVEVAELDGQHKNMFEIINRFFEMMKEKKDAQDIEGVLKELIDYGSSHLATEEKYFDLYDFPGKVGHKQAHDDYRKKMAEFLAKKEDSFVSFEMIDYLEDWWIGHITGVDKQYSEFFHSKGLK